MKTKVFDGNAFAASKERELKEKVTTLAKPLKLVSIVVGDDPASHLYVRLKGEAAQRIGISFEKFEISTPSAEVSRKLKIRNSKHETISKLKELIGELNQDEEVTGVMVQLPLPEAIRDKTMEVLDVIDPRKDVDCLTTTNLRLIQEGKPRVLPATVKAVESILELRIRNYELGIREWLTGKKVVVVGRSRVLGQPLAAELKRLGGNVMVAHSQTSDLGAVTRAAEVLVSATGKANLITGAMVKEGVVVVDVGEPKGDVDFESVKGKVSFITPVPGGVGPMTVVSLLENVVEAGLQLFNF